MGRFVAVLNFKSVTDIIVKNLGVWAKDWDTIPPKRKEIIALANMGWHFPLFSCRPLLVLYFNDRSPTLCKL